jgi:hypothetical protein
MSDSILCYVEKKNIELNTICFFFNLNISPLFIDGIIVTQFC